MSDQMTANVLEREQIDSPRWYHFIFPSIVGLMLLASGGLFFTAMFDLAHNPIQINEIMPGHEVCELMMVEGILNALTVVMGLCGLILFLFALVSKLPIKWSVRRCLIYIAIASMCIPLGMVGRDWLTHDLNVALIHQMEPIHRYSQSK